MTQSGLADELGSVTLPRSRKIPHRTILIQHQMPHAQNGLMAVYSHQLHRCDKNKSQWIKATLKLLLFPSSITAITLTAAAVASAAW